MFPIGDENPTLRTPLVTYALLLVTFAVWVVVQKAGLQPLRLAESVCNFGMVPAEILGTRPVGYGVQIGRNLYCLVDDSPINWLTPIFTMFLHGSWGHILGNSLYLWIFGNNVEDSMGRGRFLLFYLLCGLAAAGAHLAVDPGSVIPTVGASGAISGVMGAYLLLYPKARVRVFLPPFFLFRVAAWIVLVVWFGTQVLTGLPDLGAAGAEQKGGVAVWAHVGGFVAGALLIRLFENKARVLERARRGQPDSIEGSPVL